MRKLRESLYESQARIASVGGVKSIKKSAEEKDSEYFEAYLDGELVKNCVYADEEGGFVEVVVIDEFGHHERSYYGDVVTKVLRGKVEIRDIRKLESDY